MTDKEGQKLKKINNKCSRVCLLSLFRGEIDRGRDCFQEQDTNREAQLEKERQRREREYNDCVTRERRIVALNTHLELDIYIFICPNRRDITPVLLSSPLSVSRIAKRWNPSRWSVQRSHHLTRRPRATSQYCEVRASEESAREESVWRERVWRER